MVTEASRTGGRLTAAVLILTAGLVFQAIPTAIAADARRPVVLNPVEADFVRGEMQAYLVALQRITSALAEGEPGAVADAARRMGMAAMQNAPPSLMARMPVEFKQLGMPTHKMFDRIADAAEAGGNDQQVLGILSSALSNCVACHASFRIALESD